MKEVFYRQCRLKRNISLQIDEYQTSYIPEPYCTLDRVLKLKDSKGIWENGWIVTFCGEKVTEEHVNRCSRDYLKTRKVSDI